MQHLPLDPIIIPDSLDGGVEGLAGLEVDTHDVAIRLLVLDSVHAHTQVRSVTRLRWGTQVATE